MSSVSAEQLAAALQLLLKSPEVLKTLIGSVPVPTKTTKTGKVRKAKDPNAPKRPKNAYFMFLDTVRGEISEKIKSENPDMKHPQRLGLIAKEAKARWDALSTEEKAPFLASADADKTRYSEAKKEYASSETTA
jgi:non-histone protein 10